jgi:hypothetical protein
MRHNSALFLISLCTLSLVAISTCSHTTITPASPALAVYVGSTPCSAGTRPLPGMLPQGTVEMMKWRLQLFDDNGQPLSGTYTLQCSYGMCQQGTKWLVNGGNQLHRKGKWTMIKGSKTNPSAIIYRLDPDTPSVAVSFLRVSDHLIHLLDSEQRLMIGNGAFGYTLNMVP